MSQSANQHRSNEFKKKYLGTYAITVLMLTQVVSGCNMPTKPEYLPPPNISSDEYREFSCAALNSKASELIEYEISLTNSQNNRITDSQGHAAYYGWGKGDGMDTIELVKTRGKIKSIKKELVNKNCELHAR